MLHRTPTLRSTWYTFVAIVAMAVQLVVALAPLAEGRDGRSMSAHVESSGTRGHYTHDDATCASCQARSIHGTTPRVADPLPSVQREYTVIADRAETDPSSSLYTPANPRAPPFVI
jgi:hypothetical protein